MKIIIIGGPTASQKSALALTLAKKLGGAIINADSSQVYQETPILSASPSTSDHHICPHMLYNFIPLDHNFKVTEWLAHLKLALATCKAENLQPIIVGGSGFYIKSLVAGLSPVPEISLAILHKSQELLQELGLAQFRHKLKELDPNLPPNIVDPYRLTRAYSVFISTGTPLSEWQAKPRIPTILGAKYQIIKIMPERQKLYQRINARFQQMIDMGALEEVKATEKKSINRKFYKKILGLNELADYLENQITLEQAISLAAQKTRNYAKRQITWFKHQIKGKEISGIYPPFTLPSLGEDMG